MGIFMTINDILRWVKDHGCQPYFCRIFFLASFYFCFLLFMIRMKSSFTFTDSLTTQWSFIEKCVMLKIVIFCLHFQPLIIEYLIIQFFVPAAKGKRSKGRSESYSSQNETNGL